MVNDLGSKHWKYQRYSALVLAPVILWLLVRIIFRPELSYVEVKQWLTLPASSLLRRFRVVLTGCAALSASSLHRRFM